MLQNPQGSFSLSNTFQDGVNNFYMWIGSGGFIFIGSVQVSTPGTRTCIITPGETSVINAILKRIN
jgi:hypothetical protein